MRSETSFYIYCIVVLSLFIYFFVFSGFSTTIEPLSSIELTQNDTVAMTQKTSSWFGLGAPDSITVTLDKGLNLTNLVLPTNITTIENVTTYTRTSFDYYQDKFTFKGDIDIRNGLINYEITYRIKVEEKTATNISSLVGQQNNSTYNLIVEPIKIKSIK